ncbi:MULTISPECIES: magnesium-translocating P-type ATPase [Streptomyces]|uniref:Magnesium-transporting ATPase, P-type 1 n=2 Tax=Streptomyces TaxID=1883 RepID=A0ABD5EUX9_9ACTN|nr:MULTISPECIES: magnesium-translocating P-type ATPase [unclassified Streptomyces]MDT0438445.1 magnesium-translocating P-type ATPase [Streptomyces sp. DSM 41981]MYQ62074.1 magnesium-translocating P-type ATPase [Streptomyces sp. SID4950]SCD29897.1 Mg2+-importing ATPase [Streptomyces sp. SolWspMP-5a-2]
MASDTAHPAPAEPASADGTALQVLRRLDSGPRGLTDTEAAARLAAHGENTVPGVRTPSWPRRCLRGVRDPFTAVLLCLALVSAAVASWGTASVILSLVAVSCVLRATGEHRADRSIAALRGLVSGTATVLRRADGGAERAREVPVAELVPGDVIRLGPGDLVPADVRLLRARGLTVHQGALTGESVPVPKAAADVPGTPHDGPLGQAHLCFQGSGVATGSATAVVVETGARTRFAAAHRVARPRGDSAFDRSVHGISWVLIRFMLLTPPLVLMANAAVRGRGLETLPFAVAVAVGLTPEMLPVIVTTCLARGAALLARHHDVIVKRLPALHDLGAVDVLCVDKTGTLTQDRPVVARALDPSGRDDPDVLHWAAVHTWWTLQLAELPAPDALDEAILDAAGAVGEEYDGVAAVPCGPGRRIATAVLRGPGLGIGTVLVKGAVEDVLERCAVSPGERERLLALAAREAGAGSRVLALATAERPVRDRSYGDERGLAFRGLVTFHDAPAPSAAEALRTLTGLGVTVHVLTGDHPATAARACRDLGLEPAAVRLASDADGAVPGAGPTVVARCTPEDKARIVAGLRAAGHTVGFLGDGVNDVAALRAADVGIVPRDAVGVAREAGDVVLGDKDLTAIGHAVVAGRHSSGNIASYLRVTLSSNLGNVLAMLAAGLLLPFLPMLPAQVLVQNLCFDGAQLAFALDRPAPAVLRRPTGLRPRAFLRFITVFGALNAVADLATFAVLAIALHGPDALDDESVFHSAWFTENLLTQALVMVLLRTGRGLAEKRGPGPVGKAAAALAVIGLLLPPTPVGAALHMTVLPVPYHLLLGAVLGLYALALVAARARYERRHP